MKKRKPVSDIMTKDVLTADADKDTLHDVKELINKHNLRHVQILRHGKLAGIISKTDINRLTFGSLFEGQDGADEAVLEMLKIEHVMSHKPQSVRPDDTIQEVAQILATEEFHSLPVIEGDKLVGIVTTTDVIKYMLEQY